MGSKYNNSFQFLRSVYEAAGDRTVSFDKFEKKFSYIHQIMAENGGLDPLVHMSVMRDISKQLGPHVLETVFPSQVDIKSGKVKPLYSMSMQKNPIFAFLGSGQMNGLGMKWKPEGQFNQYRLNYMDNFLKQGEGIRRRTRTPFSDAVREFETGQKKGKKNYKGENC